MIIEINEREAILLRNAVIAKANGYFFGPDRKGVADKEKANKIGYEYKDLDEKIAEAMIKNFEEEKK